MKNYLLFNTFRGITCFDSLLSHALFCYQEEVYKNNLSLIQTLFFTQLSFPTLLPRTNSFVFTEESLQRIFEPEQQDNQTFTSNETQNPTQTQTNETDVQVKVEPGIEPKNGKKKAKTFVCGQCDKVFSHRNSLLYHELMHGEKKEACKECGKRFYTVSALKVCSISFFF